MAQKLILAVFFVCIAVHIANACLSSGICGGHSGCYHQQPAISSQCNCAPDYQCGRYGCYRARNRVAVASVRTKEVQGKAGAASEATENKSGNGDFILPPDGSIEPIGPRIRVDNMDKADEIFMECCETRELPDSCLKHCTFGHFTKDALMRMYFKQDACPIQAVAEMQYCAAQGKDHRECCQETGVASTVSGPKCLVLCNQVPGNVKQLDTSYMSCFDRFESMKACFWRDIMKDARARGEFN